MTITMMMNGQDDGHCHCQTVRRLDDVDDDDLTYDRCCLSQKEQHWSLHDSDCW